MRESVFPTSDRLTLSETACGSHETGPAAEEVPRRHDRDRELERRRSWRSREGERCVYEAVLLPDTEKEVWTEKIQSSSLWSRGLVTLAKKTAEFPMAKCTATLRSCSNIIYKKL